MIRILFVDDEESILDLLRSILAEDAPRWQMVFAKGADAALAELQKGPFDVVVSDLRMPGVDGAELLGKVKERWPSTGRIILTGHADREAMLSVLPVAHQFIGKPCTADEVRSAIERTTGMPTILTNEELRRFVRKLDKLPSPPSTYFEMNHALTDPGSNAADLAKIVERDPAMSAKVLQLVNSAYFGLSRRFTSVATAVPYLGSELLKNLALTVGIFGQMEGMTIEGFSAEDLQRQSFLIARIARLLCTDTREGEAAFTAGLLHDVGKIVLALGAPKKFQEAVRVAKLTNQPGHVVEEELMGFTHAEVGACLLGTWGLPLGIVEATAFHHFPERAAQISFGPLAAVHIADALVQGAIQDSDEEEQRLRTDYIDALGIGDVLPAWRGVVARELRATQTLPA